MGFLKSGQAPNFPLKNAVAIVSGDIPIIFPRLIFFRAYFLSFRLRMNSTPRKDRNTACFTIFGFKTIAKSGKKLSGVTTVTAFWGAGYAEMSRHVRLFRARICERNGARDGIRKKRALLRRLSRLSRSSRPIAFSPLLLSSWKPKIVKRAVFLSFLSGLFMRERKDMKYALKAINRGKMIGISPEKIAMAALSGKCEA